MYETKLFTVREEKQTRPLKSRIVEDIVRTGHTIRERSIAVGVNPEEDSEIQGHLTQLEELFLELEALGCSYRDWNFTVGLVDFPALIGGEEVCLCWRSDEDKVGYYHGVEEGFV